MSQTIIICAKDPNITYLLQRYAEESGWHAVPICQDDDLLDRVDQLQPALIIIDIDFVAMADWEIVRRLKTEPVLRHLPIVVYSCLTGPPDDWSESMDGFLLKSALYDEFVAVIKRAVGTTDAETTPPIEEQAVSFGAVRTDPIQQGTPPVDKH